MRLPWRNSVSGWAHHNDDLTRMMQDILGEHLVKEGKLSVVDLSRARQAASETNDPLSYVLVRLGLVSTADMTAAQAAAFKLPTLEPEDVPDNVIEFADVSSAFLKARRVLPLRRDERGGRYRFAVANVDDDYVPRALDFALGEAYSLVVASEDEIQEVLGRLHSLDEVDDTERLDDLVSGDLERLMEQASDAPVIRYVDRVIELAMEQNASDIHIEPAEGSYRTRLRIDGVLKLAAPPSRSIGAAVVSRIKIMAQLDVAERRLSQDGRIRHRVHGRSVDFRVSTSPTVHGEGIVLRILDAGDVYLDFTSLGFSAPHRQVIEQAIGRSDGIVLSTGPTGSGKTTTLYAALSVLNDSERKILSVEDPIEYTIEGVNQVQVDTRIDRTFASTLRSFLRQDPDVIMVGEIRDAETAEIAVRAALTGHLVLSTLHTNSAAATIARLLDMGIDAFLIASTLRAVLAQRLVRKLCTECREPWTVPSDIANQFGLERDSTIYRASESGCEHCRGSGYRSRTVVAEAMLVSAEVCDAILTTADSVKIWHIARQQGAVSLIQDGIAKVQRGITTLDEVNRVAAEV